MIVRQKRLSGSEINKVKGLMNKCSPSSSMSKSDIRYFNNNSNTTIVTVSVGSLVIGVLIYDDRDPNIREINYIAVHPKYRHQGVGSHLFRGALHFAKRLTCILPPHNISLNNWLRKKGFKAIGILRDFHQGSDAFRMMF